MKIIDTLTKEFNLNNYQVKNILDLMNEGATIPFIARYRKEMTGGLDEVVIRELFQKNKYYQELEGRKETIIASITDQGKMTPDLKTKISACLNKTELEDLYLPFRPKRQTRATKAKEAGLEPLAKWLLIIDSKQVNIEDKAKSFINKEKGFETPEKAIKGACDILAEFLSDDADIRKGLRELAVQKGYLVSHVRKGFAAEKTKFLMYYDYKEKITELPSHRILAMFRGEREKVLDIKLEIPVEEAYSFLESHLIKHRDTSAEFLLKETAKDAFERLLLPATETEIRKELREHADQDAIQVFSENLRELLLASPAGKKPVLGIDPGFRTGCKVTALDKLGNFLEYAAIYPHEPHNQKEESKKIILELIEKYKIELIAIGNGTAGRETEQFIRQVLEEYKGDNKPICVIVSEAGASVYSASELAAKEFPDFDLTVRGAISIGRRLQDPLSELVKIDPKAIGVGQYQHDVNQTLLKESLGGIVECSVNLVGVDVNLASEELLRYVSGLNSSLAAAIVEYRNQKKEFSNREELKKVKGMGIKTYEQSAGFLRIPEADNPLDNSAVHPERYALVEDMAASLNMPLEDLIGNANILSLVDKKRFISHDVGLPTIEDIMLELEKPGRDPRQTFTYALFSDVIKEITDLEPGMILEGVVTNVTNFGAFVDIGVHQDGLVHISEIADQFIDDPRKYVKVGQVVKVKVLNVDTDLKRIGLSLKMNNHLS